MVVEKVIENGKDKMNIVYNDKTDLLYIRLDDKKQDLMNKRISEDIVLDTGKNEKVIGTEVKGELLVFKEKKR